ncbi:MAG: L,D-transpeptidase family protein [Chloroflexota bacterium]|nr:L,D-transpeptidase family protein [Chloroflexota bacterium]
MRRRAILAGIAGTAATMLAQQIGVLAQPVLPGDDDGTTPPPPQPPPQNDPPAAPVTPSAPVAPAAPAKPVATKPDLSDPKYSPNAYPPLKKILDGPPKSGEFALTADDLNLRVNPSYNSDVVTIIPGGSQITIEGKVRDGFFPVNFQSGLGWADGKFLQRLAPEMPQPIGVGTLTESTPIFEAPDQSGKQVTNWTAGMQVTYFAEVDGTQYKGTKRWYKVLTNPDRYVSTWSIFGTPTPGLQESSPLPKSGPLAWTGRLQSSANVRIGPGTTHQVVKSWGAGRRVLVTAEVTGEAYAGSTKWYQVAAPPEQSLFLHSSFVTKESDIIRVDKPAYTGRWVDVDLANQVLTAYYGAQPLMVAQTASGTNKNPTDKGAYPTFWRLASQRMQGDNLFAGDYYNLDAVPYISYFHPSGEAIHGAYWHDNFGTQLSHGCVNASLPTAQWILTWAPLGTQVVVH